MKTHFWFRWRFAFSVESRHSSAARRS